MSDAGTKSEWRAAIITGGGTGVGAATARQLARRGYGVGLVYSRSAAEAEAVASGCRALGVAAVAIEADVSSDADCRRAAREAEAALGPVEVLVNSAGATQFAAMTDLDAQSAEDFHEVFGVNTIGAYQMVRAVAPQLRRSGRGAVVSVSSMGTLNGNGSSYAYVTSKAALNALTMALARNLAPEIRVNAVLPGLIETRWLERGLGKEAYDRVRTSWADQCALQRNCSADDIAEAIVFLAVDGTQVTGQLLNVDAGFMLGRPTRVSR
jgi:3-oxoacyl-[acyl-carrier protein] reductase